MYVSIFGDSISTYQGYNPPDYLVFYNIDNRMRNSVMEVMDTWWGKVLEKFGWELLINASYSGSRVSGTAFPSANSYDRIKALKNEVSPDVILVYLGYNDFGFCVPLKSEDNGKNPEYFFDAYRIMLERLKETYPNTRVICGTLMPNYIFYRPDISEKLPINRSGTPIEEYNELICKACSEAGVIVADLYNTGIKCDTLDGSHGTKRGHREMAQAWCEALSKVY